MPRLTFQQLEALEHVSEKWTRFSDKDTLQVFELARILFDQVIPPDRKARESMSRKSGPAFPTRTCFKFLNWREFFSIR
jgi:hypothetical protein